MDGWRLVWVQREGESSRLPGLALKLRRGGAEALVTFELDGRVVTEWLPAEALGPREETPPADPVPR